MSQTTGEPLALVAGRECGSCSLCCKVLAITYFETPKPGGKWCQHCKPGQGCAVWQNRPQGCDDFHCDWRKNATLSDDWRPDRAGFLLNQQAPHLPLEVIVDHGKPDSWRRAPYYGVLKRISAELIVRGTPVIVIVGARHWLLLPEEDVPVPTEHRNADFRLSKDVAGRWQVQFLGAQQAS